MSKPFLCLHVIQIIQDYHPTLSHSCCKFWVPLWVVPLPPHWVSFAKAISENSLKCSLPHSLLIMTCPLSDLHHSGLHRILLMGLITFCLNHFWFMVTFQRTLFPPQCILNHINFCIFWSKSFEGFPCRRIEFLFFPMVFRAFYFNLCFHCLLRYKIF